MAQRQRKIRRDRSHVSTPLDRLNPSKRFKQKEKRDAIHESTSSSSPSGSTDEPISHTSSSIYHDKYGHINRRNQNYNPNHHNTHSNPYTSPYSAKLAQKLNNNANQNYSNNHHQTNPSLRNIPKPNPQRQPHTPYNGHYGPRSPNPIITRNRISNSVRPLPNMVSGTRTNPSLAMAAPQNLSHFYNQPQMAQTSNYHANNDNVFRSMLNHNTHNQTRLRHTQTPPHTQSPVPPQNKSNKKLNRVQNSPSNDKQQRNGNRKYWHKLDNNMAAFNKQILVAQSIGINASSPHYPIGHRHNHMQSPSSPHADESADESEDDSDSTEEDDSDDEESSTDFNDEPSTSNHGSSYQQHNGHSALFATVASQMTPPPPPPQLHPHYNGHPPAQMTIRNRSAAPVYPNSAPNWNAQQQLTSAASPNYKQMNLMTPPNNRFISTENRSNVPPPIDHNLYANEESSSSFVASSDESCSSSDLDRTQRRYQAKRRKNAKSELHLNPQVASMPFTNNWTSTTDDIQLPASVDALPKKPVLAMSYSTSDINRLRSDCKIDRYGFPLKSDTKTDEDDTTAPLKKKRSLKLKLRAKKKESQRDAARKEKAFLLQWQNLLFPSSTHKKTQINWTDLKKNGSVNYKIRSLIKSGGIPQPFRSFVWSNFCAVNETRNKAKNKGLYARLLSSKKKNQYDDIIWKDIHRTFRANLKYGALGMSPGKGMEVDEQELVTMSQETLYNVLSAFSIYNEDIGYCQGMQAISALLLMYMIEEDVFFMLNTIARSDKYGKLCTCWNMQEIHLRFAQFEYCFAEYLPKLYKHLSRNNITEVSMFGTTAWFITIFISSHKIEFDLIVRIWDVYLSKGIKTVFKFGIGYLKYLEKQLLKLNSFEMLITTLNNGWKIIADKQESEKYIQMSLNLKIKHKQIEKWAKKYRKLNPTTTTTNQ
eukprot:236930_1